MISLRVITIGNSLKGLIEKVLIDWLHLSTNTILESINNKHVY